MKAAVSPAEPLPTGVADSAVDTRVRSSLRVLSISCVFPNPEDPQYGIFVHSRLKAFADLAEVKVIAPVPLIDWSRKSVRRRGGIPAERQEGNLEVFHPRWFYPPMGGIVNSFFLFLRLLVPLIRLRRHWRFDLLDAHFAYPDGVAASLLSSCLRVPFTITLRGNETMHAGAPFRRMLMGWAMRRAARVITVSEPLREFALSSGCAAGAVTVMANGVSTGLFYPRDRVACRNMLRVTGDEKIILSAGTLIERKGHHRVIDAVCELRSKGMPVRLLIAGGPGREGTFEEELRKRVRQLNLGDAVEFLGSVDSTRMAELMSAADLLCLASSREGWPNVVHESLACGTPVVATNVGGVPEMLNNSTFGLVVPVGDADGLRSALEAGLEQEWDHEAIADWAHSRPWTKVADELLKEFQRLL